MFSTLHRLRTTTTFTAEFQEIFSESCRKGVRNMPGRLCQGKLKNLIVQLQNQMTMEEDVLAIYSLAAGRSVLWYSKRRNGLIHCEKGLS